MKNLFIALALIVLSCSSDDEPQAQPQEPICYPILTRGTTPDGDYIIIKYSAYTQKKYAVSNYLDYLNQAKLCEPITLTQLEL
jgi:hypothetical protein